MKITTFSKVTPPFIKMYQKKKETTTNICKINKILLFF
jgi:hypothetical protein